MDTNEGPLVLQVNLERHAKGIDWEEDDDLSAEQVSHLRAILTPKAYINLSQDPDVIEPLLKMAKLAFKDLLIYAMRSIDGVGVAVRVTVPLKCASYNECFEFAQNQIIRAYATLITGKCLSSSSNITLVYSRNRTGKIVLACAIKQILSMDAHKNPIKVGYFYARETKQGNRIALLIAEVGGAVGEGFPDTIKDALSLARNEIVDSGVTVERKRFCCACGKLGGISDFKHCKCDPERRYCSTDCARDDWKNHAPEHRALMTKLQPACSSKADEESAEMPLPVRDEPVAMDGAGAAKSVDDESGAASQRQSVQTDDFSSTVHLPVRDEPVAMDGAGAARSVDDESGAASQLQSVPSQLPESETYCCDVCKFAPMKVNLLRCSQCKGRKYCSRKCQRADWVSGHKNECKQV